MGLTLVLASHNAGKLAELQALFDGLPLALRLQPALGIAEAPEPHATFLENALAKARHAAAASGEAALADDSGLCVDVLGGEPGVASAEWAPVDDAAWAAAGPGREGRRRVQDAANNAQLLARLQGVPGPQRRACFVCTLVALRHAADPQPLVATGRWWGEVGLQPAGEGGFGYDPLMVLPDQGCTVAQLAPEAKNRHSHRAQAGAQMREVMRQAWSLG